MEIETTTGEKIAGAGGGLTAIAAFLTWVDAGIVTVAGTSGDGIFTLVFGAIVVGLVVLREWSVVDMIATGVLGVLTTLIALNVYGNLDAQTGEEIVEATAGIGLHLTLLGGLVMIAAAVYGFFKERNPSR